jgi:hypothetical protein
VEETMKKRLIAVAIPGITLLTVLIGCNSSNPSDTPPFVSPLSPPSWIIGAWSYDSLTWVFSSDNALETNNLGNTLDYKEYSKENDIEITDFSSSNLYIIQTIYVSQSDTCASNFARKSDTTFDLMVGCTSGGYVPMPVTFTKQ